MKRTQAHVRITVQNVEERDQEQLLWTAQMLVRKFVEVGYDVSGLGVSFERVIEGESLTGPMGFDAEPGT